MFHFGAFCGAIFAFKKSQMAHLGRPGASWAPLGRFLGSFQHKAFQQALYGFVEGFPPFLAW